VVIGSWGGSWGPTGPPLPPLTSTFKNDPKCGRIDIKHAKCLYHTRIGLGKRTYDPTLTHTQTNT